MSTTSSKKNAPAGWNVLAGEGTGRGIWHKSAPPAVRHAFSSGNSDAGWEAWREHLARRKRPVDLNKLLPDGNDPLGWALPGGLDSLCALRWLQHADRSPDGRPTADPALQLDVLRWLSESAGGRGEAASALETLACGRAITRLAWVLSPEPWWALLDHLLAAVADAAAVEADRSLAQEDFSPDEPLACQLLAGELALTLSYLLPEIAPCRKLKSRARRVLSRGLLDLLDGDGLPHGKHLGLLRPLLACWTRCRAIGARSKDGCWSKSADEQYQWLVRHALRLARHDGSHVFSNGAAGRFDEDLFTAAVRFGGDGDDREIAALVLPGGKKTARKRLSLPALPDSANHSEWAATTVLRRDWSRSAERLTVVYPGRSLRMELACGKDVVCCGTWDLDVRLGGRQLGPTSDWEEVCWISDDDVDFLELEIELEAGIRVQRQMLLARADRFLLLADVVLSDEALGGGALGSEVLGDETRDQRSERLDYRGCLPLGPDVSFQAGDESREGYLVGSKRRALVLPLALPEWRSDRRIGELTCRDGALELRQSTVGCRLYAPLFLDLDRRRFSRRLTWRQLTVAESLATQPDDVAAGYRVAVGREQWLIYRSLAEKANRTLLGHNLSTEMLVARFDRAGEVEPLMEIE